MNTIIKYIGASVMLVCGLTAAADTVRFGYCPDEIQPESLSAVGSGSNNYTEAAIRLSPKDSPAFAALKGAKLTGIRCFLRADYKNAVGKNQQQIRYYQGSLSSTPLLQDKVNFVSGWNEFTFSKPLVIGDEDIYVGFQVFETNGSPYPVGSYRPASVPDANFINLDRKGFQAYTNKGALYIEAIIDTEDISATPSALAMATDYPLVVAPSSPFEAGIYLRNLSSEPINSATVSVSNAAGEISDNIRFEFDEPIAAFDGRLIPDSEIILGTETGSDVPATFTVSEINGVTTAVTHPVSQKFYVSVDAFTRVPLVEEYTSMYCINCPIMFYFLEKAMHEFGHQIVYLTRHAGFSDDDFTTPMDKALEKHFRVDFNPAVMYDRTILPGENRILHGASNDPKYTGYADCLDKARHIPALASVNITVDEEAGTVTVSGRASVGTQTTDGRLHISAYLVEDDIPTAMFPQRGIDYDSDVYAEDPLTPVDFLSSYRHNGVVRASLTAGEMGDELTLGDDEGHYSVTYTIPQMKEEWVKKNLHYVAFLHRNTPGTDVAQVSDNIVLNAGDSRPFTSSASLGSVASDSAAGSLKVTVTPDGLVVIISPIRSAEIYDTAGRRGSLSNAQRPGIYIVRATLPDGTPASAKVIVR